MYFFVRFQGFITAILGVLLMLCGVGGAIYIFIQNAALIASINDFLAAGGSICLPNVFCLTSNMRVVDLRFYAAVLGVSFFLVGMLIAALGQLPVIFADIAANSRTTNHILRTIREVEKAEAVHFTRQSVPLQTMVVPAVVPATSLVQMPAESSVATLVQVPAEAPPVTRTVDVPPSAAPDGDLSQSI